MTNQNVIECKTAEDAWFLRESLRKIEGLDVDEEILAKAGPDLRKMVCFVAASATLATTSIVAELSTLGYTEITINGKIVALNIVSLEGAINAKKPEEKHGDKEHR